MAETVKKTFFEKKIKPILHYVGMIGASAMSVAYIILMFVLVLGFKAQTELKQSIVFAVINAIVGFIIMQFLKIQGIDFAKQKEENQVILKEWNRKQPKKKKTHSLSFFWLKSVTLDLVVKAISVAFMTSAIIYIVIEGSNDYNMLLMSLVSLIMFICFGFLSLVKAYDFFNDSYIPFIEEKINERKIQKTMEVVKDKPNKQGNDMVHTNRGTNILESSDSDRVPCINYRSLVVDSSDNDNTVLVGSVHTSDSASDRIDLPIEENLSQN